MAGVDPNVYALQVALALDASQMDESLADFSESLIDLEDQISSAAQKSFSAIEKVVDSLNEGLAKISDYNKFQIKDIEKEVKKYADKKEIIDTFEDWAEEEKKHFGDIIKQVLKLNKLLADKNKLHKSETGLVEEEGVALRANADYMRQVSDSSDDSERSFRNIVRNVRRLVQYMMETDKIAEHFVTTNWRAYGSQQALAQEVRGLTMMYGILRDEALAAVTAAGEIKVPKDQLVAYAKVIAQASRFTGVSAQTLGDYARRLRQVGVDAGGLEAHLLRLSNLMYKFKLSTHDMNVVLSETTLSPSMVQLLFKGPDVAQKYTELRAAITGIAVAAGRSAEEVAGLFRTLEDPVNRMLFAQQAGLAGINTMNDYALAIGRVGKRADALERALKASNMRGEQAQLQMEAMAKAYGLADAAQVNLVADIYRQAKAMGIVIRTHEDLIRVQNELAKNPWVKSNWTLTRQLQVLKQQLGEILAYVLEPMRYALMLIVFALNVVVQVIGSVIKKLGDFWAFLESIPLLMYFFKAVKFAAGALGLLAAAIVLTGTAFTGLALSVGGFVGVFRGALMFIRLFGQAVVALAQIVGQVIVILLTSIGRGLQALGQSVTGVEKQLLAVGAALLMAGLGAYFFAQGVAVLTALPFGDMALSMAVLVIGIIALAYGLAFVATTLAPALPLVYALAVALLLVGAAVWLFGAGMQMLSQSMQTVADVATKTPIQVWFQLALGLLAVGLAARIAGPAIIFAGLGMMMLGAAAMMMATAISIVAKVLETLSAETIKNFGKAILIAVAYMVGAVAALVVIGPLLALAAVGLVYGSLALAAAMPTLLLAAIALVEAGGAMVVGGIFLTIGAAATLAGATMIFLAGLMMFLGAGMLAWAAAILLPSALAIAAAALIVGPAAMALGLGSLWLVPAAYAIGLAGAALIGAGILLKIGAWFLKSPANSIYDSAKKISTGADAIGKAASNLSAGTTALQNAIDIMADIDTDVLDDFVDSIVEIIPKVEEISTEFNKASGGLSNTAEAFSGSIGEIKQAFATFGEISGSAGDIEKSINQLKQAFAGFGEIDLVPAQFQESVTAFKKPVDELALTLQNLADAISNFGNVGDSLGSDLDQLIATLDTYTVELESAAGRIEQAIQTRAIPAVKAAEQANIREAVKSEAINTVEVMPGAPEGLEQNRITMLLEEQNSILRSVADVLGALGGDEVTKIKELLESHLNNAVVSDTGTLSSSLNRWTS